MPDFVFITDMLAPQSEIVREFYVHHPSKALKEIPDILKETWKLKGSKVFEDKIKWDIAADPIDFFGQWRGRDVKDSYTTIWIKIRCLGKMAVQSKVGHITVWIEGFMETKLPYKNIMDEAWKYMYLKLIYEQQLKDYLVEGKAKVLALDNKIREVFETWKAADEGEPRKNV